MTVWLLQSRRGGRTCGHLHVRESGAWRCRHVQGEPGAWSVVSTWLSEPQGARPKRDWDWIVINFMMFMLTAGFSVAGLAGMVRFWWSGNGLLLVLSAAVAGLFGLWAWLWAGHLLDEFRNPSSQVGFSWDW